MSNHYFFCFAVNHNLTYRAVSARVAFSTAKWFFRWSIQIGLQKWSSPLRFGIPTVCNITFVVFISLAGIYWHIRFLPVLTLCMLVYTNGDVCISILHEPGEDVFNPQVLGIVFGNIWCSVFLKRQHVDVFLICFMLPVCWGTTPWW